MLPGLLLVAVTYSGTVAAWESAGDFFCSGTEAKLEKCSPVDLAIQ